MEPLTPVEANEYKILKQRVTALEALSNERKREMEETERIKQKSAIMEVIGSRKEKVIVLQQRIQQAKEELKKLEDQRDVMIKTMQSNCPHVKKFGCRYDSGCTTTWRCECCGFLHYACGCSDF